MKKSLVAFAASLSLASYTGANTGRWEMLSTVSTKFFWDTDCDPTTAPHTELPLRPISASRWLRTTAYGKQTTTPSGNQVIMSAQISSSSARSIQVF